MIKNEGLSFAAKKIKMQEKFRNAALGKPAGAGQGVHLLTAGAFSRIMMADAMDSVRRRDSPIDPSGRGGMSAAQPMKTFIYPFFI